MSENVFIGVGGNLIPDGYPDLYSALQDATHRLAQHVNVVAISPWYLTAPIPVSNQPDFLNAVIKVHTSCNAHQLLDRLLAIEAGFGRLRTVRNAARKLDMDILAFGTQIIEDAQLSIPHPRLVQRAFVLLPWCDIAPNWRHPVLGKTIAELAEDIRSEGQAIEQFHPPDGDSFGI